LEIAHLELPEISDIQLSEPSDSIQLFDKYDKEMQEIDKRNNILRGQSIKRMQNRFDKQKTKIKVNDRVVVRNEVQKKYKKRPLGMPQSSNSDCH